MDDGRSSPSRTRGIHKNLLPAPLNFVHPNIHAVYEKYVHILQDSESVASVVSLFVICFLNSGGAKWTFELTGKAQNCVVVHFHFQIVIYLRHFRPAIFS